MQPLCRLVLVSEDAFVVRRIIEGILRFVSENLVDLGE